ncbi:MAG: T9SS type A sorting domain-containing protein [Ferruginibacter sp.]
MISTTLPSSFTGKSETPKRYFLYGVFIVLSVLIATAGNAQQVLGSFPYMDGGFESQTTAALGTTLSATNWSRQSQSGASTSIVTTSPRSGVKYATITSVATASRNLQSPQTTVAANGPAPSTQYVVQFFVKNAASVNNFQAGVSVNGTTNPTYSTAAALGANASWTKQVFVLTNGGSALSTAGIILPGRAQAGTFDVDDVVLYAGGAADVTAPVSPGAVNVGNATASTLDISWGATADVDGGGYVVVRYTAAPNADNDPNQNGIYAVNNTTTNGTGGLTGTIRYIGTGTSFTDSDLGTGGTQYWYKVYAVDKAFNYSVESEGNGTTSSSSLIPPTLIAAAGATVDAAFNVTFTNDPAWVTAAASAAVTVNGTPLTAGYSITSGNITFTPASSVPASLLQTAGSKNIIITVTGYNNAAVTQPIAAGAPNKLAVVAPLLAAPTVNGGTFATQPSIAIQDQYNNITTSTANVTAAAGTGGWTIGGTTTVAAVNGTATFTNLTASASGAVSGATVDFTSSSLSPATSAGFNIPAPNYITISALNTPLTENFNSMNATTALPLGFVIHAQTATAVFGSGVTTVTQQASGSNPTSGGTYNWGTGTTERAVGAMTSGSFASPNNLMARYHNTSGITIASLTVAYDLERYRINSAAASVNFYYSTNGSTWTAVAAGNIAAGELPTGTSAYFFTPSGTPATDNGGVISKSGISITGLSVADGSDVYLRWELNTTGGNSQGIGIDNISVTAQELIPHVLASYVSQLSGDVTKGNIDVPLAGFTLTPGSSVTFTGVTVLGTIATLTDVSNVRIYSDINGNGLIDGFDAAVSGAGIPFASSMQFTLAEAVTAATTYSYLIVADINFNGTSTDVTVSIDDDAYSTTVGVNDGSMAAVTRPFVAPPGTSTISAGSLTEPLTVSSLLNTQGAAVANFDFTITDDGISPSTDFENTEVNALIITPGAGNDIADWTQVIAGAEISDGENTAEGIIDQTSITFITDPGSLGLITDDASKTYTLKVWLKNDMGTLKTTIDGDNLVFKINPAGIDFAGSQFTGGQEQSSGSGNNAIAVTASQLAFVSNASNAGTNVAMSPAVTVSANDANGNRDTDFTEQVSITSTGTLSGSPVSVSAVQGLAAFSSLTHTAAGTGLVLNAERTTAGDWDVQSNSFTITVVTSSSDFFRSNVTTGNWGTASSWESSADGTNGWITSTLVPGNGAKTITIRNGNTITIATSTSVTADQIVIENGGTLIQQGTLSVTNDASGDDIIVQSGGTMAYAFNGTTPSYPSSSTIRINAGGVLSLRATGITTAASVIYGASHIYDDASILEWALAASPSASGITFFPNATASTVPILRFAQTVTSLGGGGTTVVNGKIEIATGATVTFTGAGTKTFRNGIRGAGNLSAGTGGQFIINGAAAELGGTGTLTLGTTGLAINSGTVVTLSSNKTIASSGTITNNGTLALNGFTLNTSGAYAGTGVISGSAASGLNITGTGAFGTLSFDQGTDGTTNALAALTLNRTSSGTLALGNKLYILTSFTPTAGVFTTNDNLVLRSTSSSTASVAQGSNAGGYITGNVTVERYIPSNGKRAWRLLAVPANSTRTIRQEWMEGDANPTANSNNLPGYGTLITTGVSSELAPGGFDAVTPSTSIRSYNGSTFVGMSSVNASIATTGGYFLFVRGSRSSLISGSTTTPTVLRIKGPLKTGDQTAVNVSGFSLVGNPYASAIDFSRVIANTGTTGVYNGLYIWDAKLGVTGGYETFFGIDGYQAVTGGGSWTAGEANSLIQSGEAFFVYGTGQITIEENDKVAGSNTKGLRPAAQSVVSKLKTRLLAGDKAYDGNVVVFDNKYSNAVDGNDAVKLDNPGENFAIAREGKVLSAEGRQSFNSNAGEATSIVYSMKNMQQREYSLEFTATNLGSGEAYLEDKYLGTKTPVSLTGVTKVSFSVTADPQSAAAGRFQLVLRPAAAPAVDNRIASISVYPNPVETSTMNVQFVKQAKGKYNLKLVDLSGRVVYSSVREHAGGSAAQSVQLPAAISRGSYQLVITNPDKTKQVQQLFINK